MKKHLITIFTSLLLLTIPCVHAVTLGYITGSDYQKFNENEKLIWLIGTMDGIMAESAMIMKEVKGPWLGRCISGLDVQQIKAIFERELSKNPEGWHAPAAFIFRGKMENFCKEKI